MPDEPNNQDRPVTKADLNQLEGRIEGFLSDQTNAILEAVDDRLSVRDQRIDSLDRKFDTVITKLDGILGGVEALQQENLVGATQLRRHDDQLQDHELRLKALET